MTRFPRLRAAAALIVLGVVPMLAAACAGPSTAGTWQLIYRWAQHFTVRAQSGTDNSVDLIWTLQWQ